MTTSMAAFGGNESCPNCGARMAADQRYCLNCGHRRGDPRLPFMDAVVFMESMSAPGGAAGTPPPPPPAKSDDGGSRWNANAALIAGVATLVLAIGVGFLIGRSGHDGSNQAAAPGKVQVVQVGGAPAGGTEEAAAATPEEEAGAGSETGKSKGKESGKSKGKAPSKKKASEVKEGSTEEKERAEEKTKEVLHSTVPTLESGAQLGEKCDPSTAGCSSSGKVDGNFFE
jgi:hypothetical protein